MSISVSRAAWFGSLALLAVAFLTSGAQAGLGIRVDTAPVQEAFTRPDDELKPRSYASCAGFKLADQPGLGEAIRRAAAASEKNPAEAVSRQYCALRVDLEWFDRLSRAGSLSNQEGCAAKPGEIDVRWEAWREASGLSESLRAKYPYAFHLVEAAGAADPAAWSVERLSELESEAKNAVARMELVRRQCEYARRRAEELGKGAPEAAGFGEISSAKDPAALLDRAYDKPGQRAGSVAVPAFEGGGAKRPPMSPSRPPSRRLDSGEVPYKSFESLTEGIRFQGQVETERAVFQKALGHLYAAPSGQDLLDEVQEMRARLGADFAAQAEELRPRHEKERLALSELKAKLSGESGRQWVSLDQEIRDRERKFAKDERFLRAAAKNPKPEIVVSFAEGGRHASGHARTETRIEGDSLAMSIEINRSRLDDGNPPRSVATVLGHELQHAADQWIFTFRSKMGANLILGENRAYLREAHLIMEQEGPMSAEPRSETVEGLRRSDVAKLARDPLGARLDQISDPLYLWHLTQADLENPEAGLRGRLVAAHRMHGSWDDERRWLIDPTEELAAARAQARREAGPYSLASWERRFAELGESTEFAKGWLAVARNLANNLNNPGGKGADWKRAYDKAEENYYRDLLEFKSRYGGGR